MWIGPFVYGNAAVIVYLFWFCIMIQFYGCKIRVFIVFLSAVEGLELFPLLLPTSVFKEKQKRISTTIGAKWGEVIGARIANSRIFELI
jgi:hypothetical protein